jgi:uncharacterized protein (DUF58 family)
MAGDELIPAGLRARLKDLRLQARRASGAYGFGWHSSRDRGAGLEFAQYRAYEPGDEPRQIDWKLYARSDRFFVREAERDSPLTLWLLLDASASMQQSDAARPTWTRLAGARCLGACAIELALRQGDRFGLIAVGADALCSVVPAGTGVRQRDRCLLELHRLQARGGWPSESLLRPIWELIAPGALVLFLSDGFDPAAIDLVERLANARRELLSVQILTAEERDFPYAGSQRFVDPESGAELLSDGPASRAQFLQQFAQARAELAGRLAACGVRHAEWVLDQPPEAVLRQFFGPRAGRAQA